MNRKLFLTLAVLGITSLCQAALSNEELAARFEELHGKDRQQLAGQTLASADKWDFLKNNKGEWFWRRVAKNHKVVGESSESYKNKQDCIANARRNGFMGTVANSDKWEFFKDRSGLWRWKRVASNGKVVGSSSESYQNRLDCVENAERHGFLPTK